MISEVKKFIIGVLKDIIKRLEEDTCHLTDEEILAIFSSLNFRELTKERACQYLSISRSTFDRMVSEGIIPRGHKRLGSRELRWYVNELDEASNRLHPEEKES